MYKGKYSDKTAAQAEPKKKNRKKPKLGTVIFYSIYFCCVVLILGAMFALMTPLNNWLETYQASQPENKSQEIYTQLFAQPDWAALYTQAGLTDTAYEGKEAYAAYMQEKIGTDALTCMETSAGLSGNRKYVIRHGSEIVASFTMTGTKDEKTQITTWELDSLELFLTRSHGVTVEKAADQTVYINGVPLDSSHTIKITTTRAEDYLPEGVHGYRTELQHLDGLLVEPEVTVKNPDGTDAPVTQDENGVYVTQLPEMEISEEEQQMAVAAAKAKALYAIRAIGTGELRKHFDSTSQIYKDICATAVFMQDYTDYRFDNSATTVSDYYRYSDDLFSAYVELKLKVTRVNGTVKTYDAATTFFFTRQENGEYRVTDITNLRIQQRQEQVRFTFMIPEQSQTMLVSADAKSLTLPQITVPSGQVFRGWAVREQADAGRIVMKIVFTPDENGIVYLPGTQPLEPMTLYPVFENAA